MIENTLKSKKEINEGLEFLSAKDYYLANLIGKKSDNRELQIDKTKSTIYYIPLKFWFCNEICSAIPLIALQHHKVEINLELRDIKGLITTNGTNTTININKPSEFELYAEYIYLEEEERRKFATKSHEYLIEQVQQDLHENINIGNNGLLLKLNHPVKDIIWVFKNKNRNKIELTTPKLSQQN